MSHIFVDWILSTALDLGVDTYCVGSNVMTGAKENYYLDFSRRDFSTASPIILHIFLYPHMTVKLRC